MKTHRRNVAGVVWPALAFLVILILCGAAQAQTFTVIHTFSGVDGAHPQSGPTLDTHGNLYGTTWGGGAGNSGTVYKLTYPYGSWFLAPLYNFTSGSDGSLVVAGVTIGPDGTLFGATTLADNGNAPGTLFNIKPGGHICAATICQWTETTLHTFAGGSDGIYPMGNVVFDSQGNLYGTTEYGGTYNLGTVYKATLSGGTWNVSVLYNFGTTFDDGGYPWDGVILDSAGNLYGTTEVGGTYGYGAVFELSPSQGGWTETLLHSFAGTDGCLPGAGLVFDGAGNLYGATGYCPTIFELSPQDGGWNFTTLYTFPGTGPYHGPSSSLTTDAAGNVYGATTNDGVYGYGNVFEMSPSNGGWTYTDLYDFTNGNDGSQPYGGVAVTGPGGYLYGTTYYGGANGLGVVYQINLGAR